MEDDETSQNEEIEALVSIYDNSLTLLPSSSGKAFQIKIDVNEATLRLNFPPDYPSISSPSYEFSAPFLNRDEKEEITDQLRDILSSSLGMPVVFSLAECVKEYLEQPRFSEKKKVYQDQTFLKLKKVSQNSLKNYLPFNAQQ